MQVCVRVREIILTYQLVGLWYGELGLEVLYDDRLFVSVAGRYEPAAGCGGLRAYVWGGRVLGG